MLFYIYMSYVLLRLKSHILKLTFSLHVYAFLNNSASQVTVGIWGGHKQPQVLNYMLLRPTYRKTFGKAIHFWGLSLIYRITKQPHHIILIFEEYYSVQSWDMGWRFLIFAVSKTNIQRYDHQIVEIIILLISTYL